MRGGRVGVPPAIKIVEPKDIWEWRERLPLDFGGYAGLVLKLADDVGSEVTTAGSILVIRFNRPVDIPVDKLSDAVPDYVGSARRDPDGFAHPVSLGGRGGH